MKYERETNIHHCFWNRSSYSGEIERIFRERLKREIIVPTHVKLHKELRQPPKPTHRDMLFVLGKLSGSDPTDRYQDLNVAIDAFNYLSLAEDSVKNQRRNQNIAEHLAQQMIYLEIGNPYKGER